MATKAKFYIATSNGWVEANFGGTSSYTDLEDRPTIPTKTSDLINDSDYTTQTWVTDQEYSKLIIGTTSTTAAKGDHTHSNILTTPPISENKSGEMRFVVLSEEPNTRYRGYLYIITD